MGEELTEALRVHNSVRERYGNSPIELSFYQFEKPAQRMFSIDIAKIEVYNPERNEDLIIGISISDPCEI